MARLAVALSGGVDSAVAALVLREEGHQVIGLSLRLGRGPDEGPEAGARVARQLGIDHQVIDAGDRFEREVVRKSAEVYSRGRTPNPCAICNARVKLPMLWRRSRKLGCEALATGHYCRLRPGPDGWRLAEAQDRTKSQAYFLARVDQALLGRLRFPLAGLTKAEVREMAREAGLEAAGRGESQDACFLDDGGWDGLVGTYCRLRPGLIEDPEGNPLGRHQGIHRYTIGQRRGLGLALGSPVYVTAIDGSRAAVVVGPEQELMAEGLIGLEPKWFISAPADEQCTVRLRYAHGGARCRVSQKGDIAEVFFAEPQRAVAPGQLAVFSRGDEILGSAWIEQSL